MNTIQLFGTLELGFIYGLLALGVYLSFRVLDFPDLTVDGSFPLGAAVTAALIVAGYNPWMATGCAVVAGIAAGLATAWLTLRWKILHMLASILVMTALYSINLRIMGRPNVALLGEKTIFSSIPAVAEWIGWPQHAVMPIAVGIVALGAVWIVYWFLTTQFGLALRATGANSQMAESQGISVRATTYVGIAFSNGLIAMAGALFAQAQGFADVTIGTGTIIVGLASVIIGEAIVRTRCLMITLLACLVGSILYRLAVAFALNCSGLGLQASDLNLVMAILIAIAMIFPKIQQKVWTLRQRKP